MKDTNPDHYKVDGADFVRFMDDPQIKGFGDWMFANGFNTGELYVNRWINVKDRLPDGQYPVLVYVPPYTDENDEYIGYVGMAYNKLQSNLWASHPQGLCEWLTASPHLYPGSVPAMASTLPSVT